MATIESTAALARTRPVAVDLFSGAGGLSLGLEQAGFDVLAAVESDPVHALVHEYNLPQTTVICRDIRAVEAATVREAARASAERFGRSWDGEIDCVAGGPSCQGFSAIGAKDPSDVRNSLVLEFARIVAETQPKYFILENVPGLLNPSFLPILERLRSALRAAGYVFDASPWTLDASDFGVPQRRRRLFLVGTRVGLERPSRPTDASRVTSKEAIDDLLAVGRFPASTDSDFLLMSPLELRAMETRGSAYARALRPVGEPDDLGTPRRWNRSLITGAAGTVHRPDVLRRLSSMPLGEREASSRLPRLDPDQVSPTLRAGTGREHGSHTSVRPIHYATGRVITVREAARLHAFPDWFRFHTTRWHALRQIGNSVPPPLARAVAASIVEALGVKPVRREPIDLGDEKTLSLSLSAAARLLNVPDSQLPPPRRRAA